MEKKNIKLTFICIFFLVALLVLLVSMALKYEILKGIFIVLAIEIIYAIIIKLLKLSPKGDKIINKAVKEGTYVQAVRVGKVKHKTVNAYRNTQWEKKDIFKTVWQAKYEYIVDDSKYKKTITFINYPEDTITLFYLTGKPKKAIYNSLEIVGPSYVFFTTVVPIIIAIVGLSLTGIINFSDLIK